MNIDKTFGTFGPKIYQSNDIVNSHASHINNGLTPSLPSPLKPVFVRVSL